MILQELCEYYDILSSDKNTKIVRKGYSNAKISYAIVLGENGVILSIMDWRDKNNEMLPKIKDKSNSIETSTFPLWDNAQYVFGYTTKEMLIDKQRRSFESFKKYNLGILENIDNVDANSLRNFLNNWNPQDAGTVLPTIFGFDEKMLDGCNLMFLNKDFKCIHENSEIKTAWENFINQDTDDLVGQCLITGENAAIERIHLKIKGFRDAAPIVGFQKNSGYDSYGKEQGYNAPVSKNAAFKYVAALNHMLEKNSHQRVYLGDFTIVFWAQHSSPKYTEAYRALFSPFVKSEDEKSEDEKTNKDIDQERLIKDVLVAVQAGKKLPFDEEELDVNKNFCILALIPNKARISISFFHRDNFGDLIKRLAQHYEDMEIVGTDIKDKFIKNILNAVLANKSKTEQPPPLLSGKILASILQGHMYPRELFATVIRRLHIVSKPENKLDKWKKDKLEALRVSIIKAYLIRKYRITNNKLKEEITVGLNEKLKEPAYLLGRLFAILEQVQWKALGDVNSGIKERFFASAASSPKRIFPQLLKNAQNHLAKMDNSVWLDKKIGEIMAGIECFPVQLNLDKQGMFMLGYYHQRQSLFTKKETQEV